MTRPPSPAEVPTLQVRAGNDIRPAPKADQAVARTYPAWPDKGGVVGDRRLTLLTASLAVAAGDEVRVIHVAEATGPDAQLYPMGPKPVLGERVDGEPTTPPGPAGGEDPLEPEGLYDGPVVPGPAVDFGYDISTYRFDTPGIHRIVWRLGDLVSNELAVTVSPARGS